MNITIDDLPPPGPTLRQMIEDLERGKSLCVTDYSIKVLRTTVSRVRKQNPHRQFRTSDTPQGARVWRTA